MNTEERFTDLQKKGLELIHEQSKIIKEKHLGARNKPKMYQKVREILSVVNSDLSKDIIEHRGEQ